VICLAIPLHAPATDTLVRTEAIPDTLPIGQNSPQKPAHGLYAEKFSGTAFTAPRHENQQTWLYRILPAAAHRNFEPVASAVHSPQKIHQIPNQLRWNPFDLDHEVDWIQGIQRISEAGDPTLKTGLAIYVGSTAYPLQRAH
jgi:homogentisate 1,2-dioxygenase